MKTLLLPLLAFAVGLGPATAQPRPHLHAKRAFAHTSEVGKGRVNKARFRRENNIHPTIDLHPHTLEKTKTVRAPKAYNYQD